MRETEVNKDEEKENREIKYGHYSRSTTKCGVFMNCCIYPVVIVNE